MKPLERYAQFCLHLPPADRIILEEEAALADCLVLTPDCVVVAIPYQRLHDLMNLNREVFDWDYPPTPTALYVHYAAGDPLELRQRAQQCGFTEILFHRGMSGDRRLHIAYVKGDGA